MTFEEDLDAAPEETDARPFKDVDVLIRGKLRTFRFTQLDGPDWGFLVAINPVRLEAPLDRQYGYNFHAVCQGAANINGKRVEGDELFDMSPDAWAKVWQKLSGHDFQLITDAIWALNEWDPSQLVAKAKKASLRESKAKQS